MARQEEIFAETIIGMKRAFLRKDDDSESDDSIKKPSNRGGKLKRKAKHVQEGKLDNGMGVKAYKRRINYNGYFRDIISKKTLRVDADGDVVDDDGDEINDELDDAEEDPYKDVKIEEILMPLTSVGSLKDHPSLSLPYTSRALDEMIQTAQEMIQREQIALFKMKRLFEGFHGDPSWMPVEMFENPSDLALLIQDAADPTISPLSEAANWSTMSNVRPIADLEDVAGGDATSRSDTIKRDPEQNGPREAMEVDTEAAEGNGHEGELPQVAANGASSTNGIGRSDTAAGVSTNTMESSDAAVSDPTTTHAIQPEAAKEHDPDETMELEEEEEEDELQPAHRMTTRAKAQAAPSITSRASSPDSATDIHPMFLLPEDTMPSINAGLSPHEADEIRRVISTYVQKQEDVVAGSWKLYNGLLKAKRMRDDVMEWCTADAHVGEMSDGEDWIDLDRWGLVEGELEKGREEEEEEVRADGAPKKTRNRRGAANVALNS